MRFSVFCSENSRIRSTILVRAQVTAVVTPTNKILSLSNFVVLGLLFELLHKVRV